MGKIIIEKNTGGLNRMDASQDSVSGLLAHGVAVDGKLNLGEAYLLTSLEDARKKGIDAGYDAQNGVSVFAHIQEFFRVHTSGQLYIYLQDKSVKYLDLIHQVAGFLQRANGEIRQLAILYHGAETILPAADPQISGTALTWSTLVSKAQAQYEMAYALYMPCHILLEGKGFTYAALQQVPSARGFNAPNVSVVLLQNGLATVLGVISKAKVNQSIGWVEKFNVYGENMEKPALIDGTELTKIAGGELAVLEAKGYIVPKLYVGKAGVYLSGGPACTDSKHDFAYLEYSRTFDKAVRGLYTALVPSIEKDFGIDPVTKKIAPQEIKMMELIAGKYLERMQLDGEISYYQLSIDPSQDILAEEKLTIQVALTPRGVARTIVAKVGFKSK